MTISNYSIKTDMEIKPFCIALITDLHGKQHSQVIESLINRHPDFIAVAGDVVYGDDDSYPLAFFRSCSSITQSFFSLGNHERKITSEQIERIEFTGVKVLDNIWIRKGQLVIGGMTSAFVTEWRETRKSILHYAIPNYEWLSDFEMEPGFHILLDHHPENYERITKERNIDLILSGHAHGGQIRIFNHGLFAPHQGFFPKYTSGVYDNRLVVSRGLANIKPIPRIGNPTELVYITVTKNKESSAISAS